LYSRIRGDGAYRSDRMSDVFVPGRGPVDRGGIVMVGEAPGRREEELGRPFAGAAGRNLDALLKVGGLLRDEIFITNVIKYRPVTSAGGNRNPSPGERAKALPYLLEELEILGPRLTVCLGLCPAGAVLGGRPVMGEVNGMVFDRHGMRILVTYHPSPFNYMIGWKREAMERVFHGLGRIAKE